MIPGSTLEPESHESFAENVHSSQDRILAYVFESAKLPVNTFRKICGMLEFYIASLTLWELVDDLELRRTYEC